MWGGKGLFWGREGRLTFGEGLGGIILHAEVVDQHDGQMLLHIP